MTRVIKINYKISGTKLTIPFKSVCSIINKPFDGNIIVEYHPKDSIIEYISFENYLKKITKEESTAEELANIIFQEVKNKIKPKYLKVLIDVKKSEAHQPVEVWVDTEK